MMRRPTLHAMRARGFTLLELMVALVIFSILLAVGVPSMKRWMLTSKTTSAAHFYTEGLGIARNQALSHNSASRLVLIKNANGQSDWRVDICFPSPDAPCNAAGGNWSKVKVPSALDPAGAKGFTSVLRSADSLPSSKQLAPTVQPADATAVYFTPLGWVDTSVSPYIRRIKLKPVANAAEALPAVDVVLTLAGIASRCNPDAKNNDLQRCPP